MIYSHPDLLASKQLFFGTIGEIAHSEQDIIHSEEPKLYNTFMQGQWVLRGNSK